MSQADGKSTGYIAANRGSGKFVVMIAVGYQKIYASCDLVEAVEVISGRRSFSVLRRRF